MSNQQQKIKKKQTRNSYPQELQEQLADYARQAPRNGQELSNKALEIFGVRLPQGTMSGMLKKYGIIIHQENKRGRRPRHLTNTLLSSSSLSSSSSSSSTFINNPNTNNANTSSSSTISQLFSLSSIKYGCQLDKPAPKVRRFRLSSFRLTEPFILEYVYSNLLSGTIPSPRSIYIATKQYIIANNINNINNINTTTTTNNTTAITSSTNNQQPSNYTSNFNQGSVKRILKKYLLTYKLDAVFKELISPQDYLLEIKEKYPMIADIKDFDLENLDYSNSSSRSFTTFTSSTFDQQQMNSTPTIVEEDENDDDDNDDDEEEEEDPFIPGENKGLFDDHYFDIFKDKELSTSTDIPDTFKFFSSDDDDDDDSDELNVEHFSNYDSLQQQQYQQYQQDQNEEEEEKDFESLQQQYEETHLQNQTEEDFESFLSKLLKKNDDDDSSNDNDDDHNDLKKDNDDINQNYKKSESEKVVILQSHPPTLSIVTSDLQNSFDYSSSSLSSSSSKFCPSSSSFTFDFVSPSTTVPSSPYDVLSPIFSNNTTTSSNIFSSSSSTMFEDERRKRRKTNTLFPLKQNQLSSPLSKSPTIVENNLDFLISDEIFNFEL